MIQKSIAIFLFFLSLTNPLSAASLFKSIMSQKAPNSAHKIQRIQSNQLYTDFSGTWVSPKCLGTPLFTLKIENTYNSITFNDSEEYEIGTMQTKSNSGVNELTSITADSDISSFEWNNTKLLMKGVSVSKSFAAGDDNTTDTHMYLTMFHTSYELDNGQLLLKMNLAEYKDLQRIDLSQPTCVFNKTAE